MKSGNAGDAGGPQLRPKTHSAQRLGKHCGALFLLIFPVPASWLIINCVRERGREGSDAVSSVQSEYLILLCLSECGQAGWADCNYLPPPSLLTGVTADTWCYSRDICTEPVTCNLNVC